MAMSVLKKFLPYQMKLGIKLILKTFQHWALFFLGKLPLGSLYEKVAKWALEQKLGRLAELCSALLCRQQKKQPDASHLTLPHADITNVDSIRISVIIPTYNRADMLPGLFESLDQQSLNKSTFEVIVVNNNCTDETSLICNNYEPRFPFFREVHEKGQSLLSARHAGWRVARADVLVFCDDDIEAFPGWLAAIDAAFSNNERLGLMGGNNIGKFSSPLPMWFDKLWLYDTSGIKINVYHSLLEGIDKPFFTDNPQLVFGCNYSIRRKALDELAGFEPDCMPHVLFQGGGETGPSIKLKKKWLFLLHPDASVYHRMPKSRLTLEYLSQRSIFLAASQMYEAFRRGALPPKCLSDDSLLLQIGIDLRTTVEQLKFCYVAAILKFPEFRRWTTRKSYYNHEMPSQELIQWAKINVPNGEWHESVKNLRQ